MDTQESYQKFEEYLRRRFPGRRTSKDYLSDLRQFRVRCQKEWREVSIHDIDTFVNQQHAQGLKQTTVNRRVAALKTFFDFLAEETGDLGWPNPVRFKRHAGKRMHSLPRDLRDEDLERVWAVMNSSRDQAWFMLMLRAGLRVGEVVDIKLPDLLNPPQGQQPGRLRVCGKGRKERIALLSAKAYAILETWLAERGSSADTHLFLNERGKPLAANGIEWLLHGYGRQAGFDLTPHQLRHTFARQVTEAGMPITSLGKLLGHAQITTTQIYTAGADPDLANAYQAAMQRLETATLPPWQPPPAACAVGELEPQTMLPPPSGVAATPYQLKEPDWEAWGREFPAEIRQGSVDYVKQRYPLWPLRRRRERALAALCELRLLWQWLLAYRPISRLAEVDLKDLWAYQTDQQAQGYTAGTINRRTDYILGVLRQLADQEKPVNNSVFRLRYLRRPDSLPKHLTETESQRLETYLKAETPDRQAAACMLLMLHSGLRSGECVDLSLQDLDLPARRLIIREGKGQRDRLVYLSEATCQAIAAYLQVRPPGLTGSLWLSMKQKPISQGTLAKQVKKTGKIVDIDNLYPHRLRHTCATRLLNAGMDITRIQKLLGHEMISTTMIYAKVQDATVEADFRQALHLIETRQTPLSDRAVPVLDWLSQFIKIQETIDNSV